MPKYYLDNIFTGRSNGMDFLYRLLVVESMESIELMVTENEAGSFQKLLKTKLKPFLEQGVKVLID